MVAADGAFEREARLKLIEIQGADGIEDAFLAHRVRTSTQFLTILGAIGHAAAL